MKKLQLILFFALAAFSVKAQLIRHQRIPTPYDFINNIKFSKPPQLSNDTASDVPNRSIAVIGSKIFVKDTTWKLITASGEAGPQGPTGLQGPTGADGNKWYEGAGVPASGANNVGDFYMNRSTGDFYEKTGASTWLVRGNLKGPQGVTGLQGPAGPPGTNGTNGINGSPGAPGAKGDPGTGVTIKGSLANTSLLPGTGAAGDSYLVSDSLWVWNEVDTDWKNVGLIRGPQGVQGNVGTPGSKIYDQAGTPVAANGAIGDFYINRTTGDYYEKTASLTWTIRGSIKGPKGDPGAVGNEPVYQVVYGTGTAVTSSPDVKWNPLNKNLKITGNTGPQITLSDGADSANIKLKGWNLGIGKLANASITTAISNFSFGNGAGSSITTGNGNSNFGSYSGESITTGSNNSNVGTDAGSSLSTGYSNINIGVAAGKKDEDGNGGLTTGNFNTMIGPYAGSASQKKDAQFSVAIGYGAFTNRDHQIAIGSNSSNEYQMAGKVAINSGAKPLPDASSILDISSTQYGALFPRLTTTQRTAIAAPAEGLFLYDKDLHTHMQYNGTAWESLKSTATAGSKWYDQPGAPSTALGSIGDFYINRTTQEYYEKTGVSAWSLRGSLKGADGSGSGGGNSGGAVIDL